MCHPERSEGSHESSKFQGPLRAFPPANRLDIASMKEHQYFVYIMSSRSGTLYIGMTNSICRRTLQHKSGEIEGFSSKCHCSRLVHYESFEDVHRAIGREKELKGWTRAKKIALIESRNPGGPTLPSTGDLLFCSQGNR